ncbi:MAG TPA: PaaI family thioesterase [Candidatus Krumholzibacteria bacterium]|nr:PaaI family thioesterase [Candidatus Krumholzibacteria bacterium]HPD70242.1 PaaI family thioesterase [Candidatus Krumholzibacteria bacterium]HRY40058.1 PaaI family thioesterase [Candidatus Krumholzibacteria bacterium]
MKHEAAPAVQDHYPEDVAHCYGCGRFNRDGLQLKSRQEGSDTVARITPRPYHTAMPGFVYGGLIASLVDCHAMGTAATAAERAAGRQVGDGPAPRFVTAQLNVTYLKPTPLGPELEVRGRVRELGARKAVVEVTVAADGEITARGEVVAVRIPDTMLAKRD